MAEYADCIQIGARNMQNYSLLRAVGRIGKPVLLKRGMAATVDDLLLSAEYVLAEGNDQVILCERGVRSFDPAVRNMFDLTAIPIVHKLSHLPIIADPSHGTGLRDQVTPMARAAVAAGADGLLVEVHPAPDRALSDGAQSLYPDNSRRSSSELRPIVAAIGRGAGRTRRRDPSRIAAVGRVERLCDFIGANAVVGLCGGALLLISARAGAADRDRRARIRPSPCTRTSRRRAGRSSRGSTIRSPDGQTRRGAIFSSSGRRGWRFGSPTRPATASSPTASGCGCTCRAPRRTRSCACR